MSMQQMDTDDPLWPPLNVTKTNHVAVHIRQAINGLVERLHRHLKAALKSHSTAWIEALPLVLLGIRAAVKSDIVFLQLNLFMVHHSDYQVISFNPLNHILTPLTMLPD
ncbi:Uncharacterised protein g9315 [Pycnogonum litorale]